MPDMPDIQIFIAGIIILRFNEHASGELTECLVGVVDDVPDHELTITGKKTDAHGTSTEFEVDPSIPELFFEVKETSETGIRLFNLENLDRIGGVGDPQSFSWVLDFESAELFNTEIGVDPTKFRNILHVDTGEMFTEVFSPNHLLHRPEDDPHEPFTLLGRVATLVGIRQDLDQQQSVARLHDGTNTIVEVVHGEKLELNVFLTCETKPSELGQQSGHANNYYRAAGQRLPWGKKKLFSSTKFDDLTMSPPATPEAACLIGRLGPKGGG